jgi:uncharacterized protein (TIGR02246 family)
MTEMNALAAELEIRNLVARVAQLADDGDLDEYMRCYTKDAVWAFPGTTREGHDAIRQGVVERRAGGHQGPGSNTMHVVASTSVELMGETATANSSFLFIADTLGARELQTVGRYRDRFVITDDGWKIAHRTIVVG